MSLLPEYIDFKIVDGSFLHAMPYCKKNCNHKCASFYQEMHSAEAGFYRCPHGMSIYVSNKGDKRHIFTGLRIKGFYDRKVARATRSKYEIYNPVLETKQIEELAASDIALFKKQKEFEQTIMEFRDLTHETRKINGQIKNICEMFLGSDSDDSSEEESLRVIRDVFFLSYIAYNRFQSFEVLTNPTLLSRKPIQAVIYKKFDKMRKLGNCETH